MHKKDFIYNIHNTLTASATMSAKIVVPLEKIYVRVVLSITYIVNLGKR